MSSVSFDYDGAIDGAPRRKDDGRELRQMTPFTDSAFGAGGEVVTGRYYLVEAGAWD